jgi:hypothetical protein
MVERDHITCLSKRRWRGSLLGEKYLGASDKRRGKTNWRIEKRCLGNSGRRHIETNYKTHPSGDRGEEPKGSWEEWSWIYD